MHPKLQSLLILQDRDSALAKASAELDSVPKEAEKIKSKLQEKLNKLQGAKDAYLQSEKAVKQVDLDRQVRKETITKLKMRQGETKRNEEYQMLSHEIVRYENEIDELETQELELMESVDQKKMQREAAKTAFEEEKVFATELTQQLVARKKSAEEKIVVLKEKRAEAASKVDGDSLSLYERVFKSRGGTALVLVTESGQCRGCNIKLPPATVHRVIADKELIQCSECSRILYNA